MAKTTKKHVSMEAFMTAWERSNSVAEVSEKTGIKTASVIARGSQYRAKGLDLKHFPRGGGARLNIEDAKALLAKLRAENVTVKAPVVKG